MDHCFHLAGSRIFHCIFLVEFIAAVEAEQRAGIVMNSPRSSGAEMQMNPYEINDVEADTSYINILHIEIQAI